MKRLRISTILLLSTMLLSCGDSKKNKEITDPEEFAEKYCDCMKKHDARGHFAYALTVCDGEFFQKSRLYRLYKTDLQDFEEHKKISRKTSDSIRVFARMVDSLTSANCCEVTANCHGSGK